MDTGEQVNMGGEWDRWKSMRASGGQVESGNEGD